MSGNINIRRDVQDSFYRYKMPRIQSKIEGKGNGIKTVIPNISNVAKALHRPPSYPTKYFGIELGAQVKLDEANDRYIVNGAHDAPKLQDMLDGFISKFVLCAECLNPETDLVIQKSGNIIMECKACGKTSSVDMNHRLSTFITKNPPGAQAGARYGGSATQSVGKSSDKKKSSRRKGGDNDDDDGDDDVADNSHSNTDDEVSKKMDAEAAEMKAREAATGAVEIKSSLDSWSVDTSAAAAAARQKDLGGLSDGMARQLNLNDDDDDDGNDPMEELAEYIESDKSSTLSNAEILAKVSELKMRPHKAVVVLAQTLFDEDILKQFKPRLPIFDKLVGDGGEKGQKALLGGLERLVGVCHPKLLPKIALILKAAYDGELLDEEVIIAWGKKSSKKYVSKDVNKDIRKKAEPFLNWLETAEEDTSDDDEDDE